MTCDPFTNLSQCNADLGLVDQGQNSLVFGVGSGMLVILKSAFPYFLALHCRFSEDDILDDIQMANVGMVYVCCVCVFVFNAMQICGG